MNQTFNFYAPIGQQIAHVDKIEAHFDKDMTMHVDDSDGALAVDNGKGNADFSDNGKAEATADDMFRFIHPSLEDADAQAAQYSDAKEQAAYFKDVVKPAMDALRAPADRLEMIVDKEFWPMPSYGDLMFEV